MRAATFPLPVRSVREGLEAVREALAGRNRTLSDVADSVHPRCVGHKHSVPVDRDTVRHEAIDDMNHDLE